MAAYDPYASLTAAVQRTAAAPTSKPAVAKVGGRQYAIPPKSGRLPPRAGRQELATPTSGGYAAPNTPRQPQQGGQLDLSKMHLSKMLRPMPDDQRGELPTQLGKYNRPAQLPPRSILGGGEEGGAPGITFGEPDPNGSGPTFLPGRVGALRDLFRERIAGGGGPRGGGAYGGLAQSLGRKQMAPAAGGPMRMPSAPTSGPFAVPLPGGGADPSGGRGIVPPQAAQDIMRMRLLRGVE